MTLQRPSLLILMAGAATLSMVTHGVSASPGDGDSAAKTPQTRLGSAIKSDMAKRKAATTEQARALDLREQVLKASEKRLEAALDEQKKGGSAPRSAPTGKGGGEDDAEIDQLARIYQSMKAKQAAVVFEQLHIEVQIAVARKMRERSTAQIMAAMTPAAAARLSMALAGHRPRRGMMAAK